jgi:hypothetical protein
MKKTLSYIVAGMFLLTNCTSPRIETDTPVVSPASNTPTLISTNIPIPTETPLPSVTATPLNNVVQNCLDIKEEISLLDVTSSGVVVLGGEIDESPYLLNLQTGDRYELPLDDKVNSALYGVHSSPDGKKLAYIEDIQNNAKERVKQKIWVVDTNGSVLSSQEINSDILFRDWRWLDNENLHFNFRTITPEDGVVVLFNPFTKDWKYLSNELLDLFPYFDVHRTSWLVEYNPNLEWVVYLGDKGGYESGPIVWDLESNKLIWHLWGDSFQDIPQWSPAGDELAVVVDGYFYRVNRDGQSISLPEIGQESKIVGFSWAPDGLKIALLVQVNQPEKDGYLMLYNIQDNQVVNYCIESDNLTSVFPPVWSLDSQLVSFRTVIMKDDGPWETLILLDVKNKAAYKLPEAMEPLAWMK